jgi:hypothetical protein
MSFQSTSFQLIASFEVNASGVAKSLPLPAASKGNRLYLLLRLRAVEWFQLRLQF